MVRGELWRAHATRDIREEECVWPYIQQCGCTSLLYALHQHHQKYHVLYVRKITAAFHRFLCFMSPRGAATGFFSFSRHTISTTFWLVKKLETVAVMVVGETKRSRYTALFCMSQNIQ